MSATPITLCRLCRSPDLVPALKLADIPLADGYSRTPTDGALYPAELWLCARCGHLQMGHALAPELMFGGYLFRSSDSPRYLAHLHAEVDQIAARFRPASVLEIGANDGTALARFQDHGCAVLGVDPARVAPVSHEIGQHILASYFSSALARGIARDYGRFECVLANHVFAHAPDLGDMLEGIKWCLRPGGVFVFENAWALDMVRGAHYDQVYHEHASFHALGPLMKFFDQHGMELFDARHFEVKGGSIRGYVQTKGDRHQAYYPNFRTLCFGERFAQLDNPLTYAVLSERIARHRAALPEGPLVGYGAASSCTPVIYNLGIQDRLEFLVDDNPRRQGLYSPGANIPVRSPAALAGVDLPVVVLALRYARDIAPRAGPRAVVLA